MPLNSTARPNCGFAKILAKLPLYAVVFALLGGMALAQDTTSHNVIELYLNQSRKVPAIHPTRVLAFDDEICVAQTSSETVEFTGIKRGESVVFVWTEDGSRTAYLVRVVSAPEFAVRPSLQRAGDANAGHGFISSAAQSLTGTGQSAEYVLFHRLDYEQGNIDGRLSVRAQGQDSTLAGSPLFNLNTATIQYQTGGLALTLLDSIFNVNGPPSAHLVPSTQYGALAFRGGDVLFARGRNSFEAFAGTTLPVYFLSNKGTKAVAGFNFSHAFSSKLSLFSTSAATEVPVFNGTVTTRRRDAFQTIGLTAKPAEHWAIEADGGVSTSGGHAQVGVLYARYGRSAYVSATSSSINFPLNQLQILPTGKFSINAGGTQAFGTRVVFSTYYQRMAARPDLFTNTRTTSDYVNPNLSILITPKHRISFNYTLTHTQSNQLSSRSNNQREDVALSSQLTNNISNTAQVIFGALADPLQFNAQSQFSARDSLNFRLKQHTLNLTVSHDRIDPSLANQINQQIQLLPPALRDLFLLDPAGFLASGSLSPQLRALIQGIQPSNTQATLSGQFLIGRKINFSPMVGYFHQDQGLSHRTNTQTVGYTFNWQLTETLSLQSSLSNILLWDSAMAAFRRTSLFSIGLTKSFSGIPAMALHSNKNDRPIIRGLVFRDADINGTFSSGEAGLADVLVRLDDGHSVRTDQNGRFEFSGLGHRDYKVSVEIAQFGHPVRFTTPVVIEAYPSSNTEVDFGVVDFARVVGTVFNDYLSISLKQPDSTGIANVELVLKGNGQTWKTKSDASGEFEIDNLPAGSYDLSLDRSSIPPDYIVPADSHMIEVGPAGSFQQDIPLRALRSVSGSVVFRPKVTLDQSGAKARKTNASSGELPESKPRPLAGVKLTLAGQVATTDGDGNFIFRELPGGSLQLTIIPDKALPDAASLPLWAINLPHDAFKAEGVVVAIANPDLLPYLVSNYPTPVSRERLTASTSATRPSKAKPLDRGAKSRQPDSHSTPIAVSKQPEPAASGATAQAAESAITNVQPSAPDSLPQNIVIPILRKGEEGEQHLIDCAQTVAKNRGGRKVLVCSEVITNIQ